MSRFTVALVAIASLAGSVSASEPHLRIHQGTAHEEETIVDGGEPVDMSGKFSVEKGIACEGGFEKSKGVGKSCKGGMKAKYGVEMTAKDIAEGVAEDLFGQSKELFSDERAFMANQESMDDLMEFDNSSTEIESLEEGFSKTVEFGGFMKAEWGCKVTYSKTRGKFTKTSECGFKGKNGMGRAPKDDDDDEPFLFY